MNTFKGLSNEMFALEGLRVPKADISAAEWLQILKGVIAKVISTIDELIGFQTVWEKLSGEDSSRPPLTRRLLSPSDRDFPCGIHTKTRFFPLFEDVLLEDKRKGKIDHLLLSFKSPTLMRWKELYESPDSWRERIITESSFSWLRDDEFIVWHDDLMKRTGQSLGHLALEGLAGRFNATVHHRKDALERMIKPQVQVLRVLERIGS